MGVFGYVHIGGSWGRVTDIFACVSSYAYHAALLGGAAVAHDVFVDGHVEQHGSAHAHVLVLRVPRVHGPQVLVGALADADANDAVCGQRCGHAGVDRVGSALRMQWRLRGCGAVHVWHANVPHALPAHVSL